MIELSPQTRLHILALFLPGDIDVVEQLLTQECGENLALIGATASSTSLERIRFAVLRVSGGNVERLKEAIRMARTDWRDILVAAGFAEHLDAHLKWIPERFDSF